jgi:ABC-type multidrug transport system permease subunit
VATSTLPSWLQPVAEWNPTSTLTASLRQLWGNPNPVTSTSIPSQYPVLVTLAWVVIVVGVFGTLGVRRYRSMSR